MSTAQHEALIRTHPAEVGNAHGIPPAVRDHANRAVLQTQLGQRRLFDMFNHAALKALSTELNGPESARIKLLAFDPNARGGGRIVLSVGGDPYQGTVRWQGPDATGNLQVRLGEAFNYVGASDDRTTIVWAGSELIGHSRQLVRKSLRAEQFEIDRAAFEAGQISTGTRSAESESKPESKPESEPKPESVAGKGKAVDTSGASDVDPDYAAWLARDADLTPEAAAELWLHDERWRFSHGVDWLTNHDGEWLKAHDEAWLATRYVPPRRYLEALDRWEAGDRGFGDLQTQWQDRLLFRQLHRTNLAPLGALEDPDEPEEFNQIRRDAFRVLAEAAAHDSGVMAKAEEREDAPHDGDPVPQLPARIGPNLNIGGSDVVEKFDSGNAAFEHIKQLVLRHGGEKAWRNDREQIEGLYSDAVLRAEAGGLLRGGRSVKHVIRLGFQKSLSVVLSLDGADPESELHFKEHVAKLEYEHTADNTKSTGRSALDRGVATAGGQVNVSHPNTSMNEAAFVSYTGDSVRNEVLADRQISGAQTDEPSVRFHGKVKAVVNAELRVPWLTRKIKSLDIDFQTELVVPKRDVDDDGNDDIDGDATELTGPPSILETRALTGTDTVTNLWLMPDDGDQDQSHDRKDKRRAAQGPDVWSVSNFVTSADMRKAFKKAYGSAHVKALNETDNWLTVERLQASLPGMTNKQPLVLHFENVPGARLEVHAFVEPLSTPSKPHLQGEASKSRLAQWKQFMRLTGKTKKTEFHAGTEIDTSLVRQEASTWSYEVPVPGRVRAQDATSSATFEGGMDGNYISGRTQIDVDSRRIRTRNTVKLPVEGEAWRGQVRFRIEMHGAKSPSPTWRGASFKGRAMVETRARFDAMVEGWSKPLVSYLNEKVWAPPPRIWGDDEATGMAGMAGMDKVLNLDLGGFHGAIDSLGRQAFGGDWKNVARTVKSSLHLNAVRDGMPAMTQGGPLVSSQLSGPGSHTKASLTAEFDRLTFQRVITPLSSPSTEFVQGSSKIVEHNKQTTPQVALGGRNIDIDDLKFLMEPIVGTRWTTRDRETFGEQQRHVVASKIQQEMAIFTGQVLIKAEMVGSRATTQQTIPMAVTIAIPTSELRGSRIHDAHLPPTFDKESPTGFIDTPRAKGAPDPVEPPKLKDLNTPKAFGHKGRSPDGPAKLRKSRPANVAVASRFGRAAVQRHKLEPRDSKLRKEKPPAVLSHSLSPANGKLRKRPPPKLQNFVWDEQRFLKDSKDGHETPPSPTRVTPQWQWDSPPRNPNPPKPPAHASLSSWHPSDMIVGLDRDTAVQEAIRRDLAAVLPSGALEHAMEGVSRQFGPRVLRARLTHQSGRQLRHDVPVPGGKVTIKIRFDREPDAKHVGASESLEVDTSAEFESSFTHTHGLLRRNVLGGRVQVPTPWVTLSSQVTHYWTQRPSADPTVEGVHGISHLSDVRHANLSGEADHRQPNRVRVTEPRELFRHQIRFHISYETSLGAKLVSKGKPRLWNRNLKPIEEVGKESPPVRIGAVFAYPRNTPKPPRSPSTTSTTPSPVRALVSMNRRPTSSRYLLPTMSTTYNQCGSKLVRSFARYGRRSMRPTPAGWDRASKSTNGHPTKAWWLRMC